jgi:hypothetical protein
MNDPFTMTEYIVENKLGVSVHDAAATRLIADHLRKKGYRSYRGRKGGKVCALWSKKAGPNRELLVEKLKGLK